MRANLPEAPDLARAGVVPGAPRGPIRESDLQRQERAEDELIMHLERDQFVVETSRPVPAAELDRHAIFGLWALRVFVVLVSAMVIYTFVANLR